MSCVVSGLGFRYGSRRVFEGLSFRLERGMVSAVLGANGSGKSTLLRVIAGLLRPSAGELVVNGRVGYAPQEWGLYEELTVRENLEFFARAQGGRVAGVLERFGLESRTGQRSGELSHGWRQRLSLACAVAHAPHVLLLDEVTSGLDAAAREGMWRVIAEEAARGAAVLVSTHLEEEAQRCAMRLELEVAP
jgi:ABC-2 type transport system ATP-binding protein